ncbi:hypothetical protein SAMN04489835_4226 [Mycolicibacterium rutilum]|uniref:Uncharacterized protein n=1 Tax=Mycolicibacterium rutilum TaxID=370526 RepID=A0A1H6KVB5_MYCRU|nr:hypothetical protein [Mycolicibacterium rutilum]SEH79544.1 hypothetical protein SAMN04489835_4226 [Mycolicibacterium rutilum]
MSLTQLKSQIEDLRAQGASIQKRSSQTKDSIANDRNLSEQGRQAKLDAERDRTREQLRDLKRKETELINTKKQTLERKLFGLPSVTSSDPAQVLLYRDSQDRAARLARSDEAEQVFAAALRSDDKTLAAAVLARALEAGWPSIINAYISENPSAGEDLKDLRDLAELQQRSFDRTLTYLWGA